MKRKMILALLTSASFLFGQQKAASLKVLTINAWSGLDYKGTFKMGEYERPERREERFQKLAGLIRKECPDAVFIQEANPAGPFASHLSELTGYDEIHQVCNAGIKVGPLGIPANLKEGIVILAKPELKLKKRDTWKLSGSFGIYGDPLSMHFDQSAFSLVGKILFNNTPVYLVNVHLSYCPPLDSTMMRKYEQITLQRGYSKEEKGDLLKNIKEAIDNAEDELEVLKEKLPEISEDYPVIVAGDFNLAAGDQAIRSFVKACRLTDSFEASKKEEVFTWNPNLNKNALYSIRPADIKGEALEAYDLFCAAYDSVPRRIDYVFLNNKFSKKDLISYDVLSEGGYSDISDHYGVMASFDMEHIIKTSIREDNDFREFSDISAEPLPVVSYDNDAGFGYGVKGFLLNQLSLNESFDLILFNSTKGERWYKMVFSLPDIERRQGKIYPFAFDLAVDYDKWINNSFYGTGYNSTERDKEYYTKEPLDISITSSRGFTPVTVGQLGLRFKSIRSHNFSDEGRLRQMPEGINSPDIRYISTFINFRYDTRNSYINAGEGIVLMAEAEVSLSRSTGMNNFSRISANFQHYTTLFYPKTVLASRVILQSMHGSSIPIQMLLSLGGNSTLRGFPQDRFLDRNIFLLNTELRFPVYRRLGAIAGIDLGRVSAEPKKVSINDWAFSPAAGLRFYMDNFIIRLDMGFSREGTGLYFNFNHIF